MASKYAVSEYTNTSDYIELPHYAPAAATDLAKDYLFPKKLTEFEKDFEGLCRSFIRSSSPDHNNGSYFDAVIERYCDEALAVIDLQRQEHIQIFSQSVAGYEKGIRVKLQSKLQMVLDGIEEIDKKIAKCRKVYYRGTSMEEA